MPNKSPALKQTMTMKLSHLLATLARGLALTLVLILPLRSPTLHVYAADINVACDEGNTLRNGAHTAKGMPLDVGDQANCTPADRRSFGHNNTDDIGPDPFNRTPRLSAVTKTFIISASKDNTLYEDTSGALSNGAGQHFFAGKNNSGKIRQGVIAFDIAGHIPAGSTVISATLKLNMSRTRAGAKTVTLHTLQTDWGEGTSDAIGNEGSGAAAAAGDATWVHTFFDPSDTSTWTTPGGDFAATPSAAQPVGEAGFYTWDSTPDMVADVQGWLDSENTNFGWLLKGDEAGNRTSKRFDSKDHPTPANRPTLIVTVQVPANQVNVSLAKEVRPTSAQPGDTITYTLTFSNASIDTAMGVIITDIVPVTLTNVSISSSGVTVTETVSSPCCVWQVADLAQNERGVITISGQVNPSLSSSTRFTNTATITSAVVDTDSTDNSASAGLTVLVQATDPIVIDGPTAGLINTSYSFTATLDLLTAVFPLTYTWRATDQVPVTQTNVSGLIHSVAYTWTTAGPKTLTVTASNVATDVVGTHMIVLTTPPEIVTSTIYLPAILK